MRIQISDSFNFKKLIRFTMPSIIMLIFTSVYGVVDGFFVSNFVGKTAFAATNFIYPVIMILGSCGFMLGTGGGALISKTMGEGKSEKAKKLFSLIVYCSIACGILLAVLGFIFIKPIASMLGAQGELLTNSVTYARIILIAIPAYILQFEFQCLFVTAGKPTLGLYVTIAAGLTNMLLDALFVAVFKWGLEGAAVATAISQLVGGLIPVIYFACPNRSLLRLGKTNFDIRALIKTCTNGASELMSNISMSLVSMLYNAQLLKYAGEDGVAAYGVLMYVSLVFQAVYIGYSVGTAPIIGYNYGAQNHKELKSLIRKSLILTGCFAVIMFAAAFALSKPLSNVFVGYDERLLNMTVHAFSIFSFSFLFSGFAIFGSSFFTALNNGLISALISFMRTLVFQVATVLIFPLIWQLDGIWISIVAADFLSIIVTIIFLKTNKKKYHY